MAEAASSYDPYATSGAGARWRAKTIVYAVLVLFAAYYLMPLVVVILNSFRDLPEIAQNGLIAWPRSFNLKGWFEAWDTYCVGGTCAGVKGNFYNSLRMTIPATIISTAIGALNGYILSKWRFPGSEWIFGAMTLGDRKSTRLNSSHVVTSRMPSSA